MMKVKKRRDVGLVFVLLTALIARSVAAQNATSRDTATIRQAIIALEQRIGAANFSCDYKFFAAIEAPEFIFTDSRGEVSTRAQDLAGESSCRRRRGTYVLDDIRLLYLGDVVVFNARATTTVQRDTLPPVVGRNRFTDVLALRNSQWLLVSGHSTRLP